jgi:lipopolysaccharide exporter
MTAPTEPVEPPVHHRADAIPSADRADEAPAREGRRVGRNMLALVASQFVTTPISMVVNAMMARALGAETFGAIYLATTILTLGFLFVEWGGYSQVAASVARDRATAPRVLGTGLLLRVLMSAVVLAVVPAFGRWMHYDATVQLALLLCGIRLVFVSLGLLCAGILRGLERIRWHAAANMAGTVVDAALVAAVLLSGGGLRAVLTVQVFSAALTLVLQLGMLARLRIGRLSVDRPTATLLVGGGFSFLVLEIILKLQPYIDATFMERLADPRALGWYSAATRIQGVLLFPATTLTVALYPTLVRLWKDDRSTCDHMVRLALRAIIVLGVLAATGTALFSTFVVDLVYGREGYAPAAANLSILSAYVVLVYASMVLGTALIVGGRQWKYAIAQSLCLVVSLVLDPILIPWAQRAYGNGGLGVCISVVTAETLMVGSALALLPSGPLDRSLARTLGRCLLAAGAMVAVGVLLRAYPLVAIPATVGIYAGLLWIQREIDPDLLMLLRRPGRSEAVS